MKSCSGLLVDKTREGVGYSSPTNRCQKHERGSCGVFDYSPSSGENVPCILGNVYCSEFLFFGNEAADPAPLRFGS